MLWIWLVNLKEKQTLPQKFSINIYVFHAMYMFYLIENILEPYNLCPLKCMILQFNYIYTKKKNNKWIFRCPGSQYDS